MAKKNAKSKSDLNVPSTSKLLAQHNAPADFQGEWKQDATVDINAENLINKQVIVTLVWFMFFSMLMFTLPFGAFFGTRFVLTKYTMLSDFEVTSLSVVSAVVTIYMIIGIYAYKAYHEDDSPDQPKAKRQQKHDDKINKDK